MDYFGDHLDHWIIWITKTNLSGRIQYRRTGVPIKLEWGTGPFELKEPGMAVFSNRGSGIWYPHLTERAGFDRHVELWKLSSNWSRGNWQPHRIGGGEIGHSIDLGEFELQPYQTVRGNRMPNRTGGKEIVRLLHQGRRKRRFVNSFIFDPIRPADNFATIQPLHAP